VWLVYAKKHSRLPSLTYNDAVEEALCFGWIDSKINPLDDAFYMQMFTPRKLKSAWSALNKTRVERLLAAGLMTPAGLVVVKAAKNSGVLYRLAGAKRPDTRARYLQDIIENMARNISRAERMERAGFRPTPKPSRPAKH
jgi:uncharacterized protein YdeI (YjbR/CyaY-like superfamily)